MDAIIKNDKLRRTACYDDVVNVRQDKNRLIITDEKGWATPVRLQDDAIVMLRVIANKNYRS